MILEILLVFVACVYIFPQHYWKIQVWFSLQNPDSIYKLHLYMVFLYPALTHHHHRRHHHHHHCMFVSLEDILQSTVIQDFLSSQLFSKLLRSFSWSQGRLMLEYLAMSFRIKLSHVVFGLPADLFHVFTKAFGDLLAGVSESKRSRWPNHDSLLLHIVRINEVTLVHL